MFWCYGVFILKIVLGSFVHWTLFWYQVLVVCFCWFWIMNVLQSMRFCVMEDNRLTKRVESFLEPFAHGFSYKKHFFSRSVMFIKIPNFVLFLLDFIQNWFVVVLVLRLYILIFGQIAMDGLGILFLKGNSIEICFLKFKYVRSFFGVVHIYWELDST